MVEALRASPSFVPELSLVAFFTYELAGHLLLTKIDIEDGGVPDRGLSLGPLSVPPKQQSLGVGSMLVVEAHARAERLGFDHVLVVGPPGYYTRFGYEPLHNYPTGLPFLAPGQLHGPTATSHWFDGRYGDRLLRSGVARPLIAA